MTLIPLTAARPEASAKIRTGGPEDSDTPDADLDVWSWATATRRYRRTRAPWRTMLRPGDPRAAGPLRPTRPGPSPEGPHDLPSPCRGGRAGSRHDRHEVRRSSVADAEKVRHVATRFVEAKRRGLNVVGTVSAMGKSTDSLIALAEEVSPAPNPRELDMLLSTGERIACALVAMAIHDLGEEAVSHTGSQAGIVTDSAHWRRRSARSAATGSELPRGGEDRPRRGLPGVSRDTMEIRDARPGRHGRHRQSRWRRCSAAACEIYSDVAGVYNRPADRPGRAQARCRLLRRDARDGRLRAPRC